MFLLRKSNIGSVLLRRGYVLLVLAVWSWQFTARGFVQVPDPVDSTAVLDLVTFATYPTSSPDSAAIGLDHPKDGSGRIFVSTNEGKIYGFSSTGEPLGVFLDLAEPGVAPDFDGALEFTTRGLSYIAFHPDYGKTGSRGKGKLYTLYKTHEPGLRTPDYSAAGLPTKPGDVLSQYAIAEWTVAADDVNGIDASSRREVIRFEFSGSAEDTHSVGQLVFNRFAVPGESDYGVLYIPLGDMFAGGGRHNWQHTQDEDNPFGKVLRIDPLKKGDDAYSVPLDNPFADGGPLLDDDGITEEIAAVGFRYPENMGFARDLNGNARLLVFDIGASEYEELNIVDIGDNHGWPRYDGPVEVDLSPRITSTLNPFPALRREFPAAVYDHDIPNIPGAVSTRGSTSITGGFVVSDPDDPAFQGQVVFSDLARGAFFHADFGELLSADVADVQAPVSVMYVSLDGSPPGLFSTLIDSNDGGRGDARFGVDEIGRLFIISRQTSAIYLTDLIAD